jgi:hypothetical protein
VRGSKAASLLGSDGSARAVSPSGPSKRGVRSRLGPASRSLRPGGKPSSACEQDSTSTGVTYDCSHTSTMDGRDSLIGLQYDDTTLYNAYRFLKRDGPGSMPAAQRTTAHFYPSCGDLWLATTPFNDSTSKFVILQAPLLIDTLAGYGYQLRVAHLGQQTITSGYRTPQHNKDLAIKRGDTTWTKGSAHLRGVAVDLNNATASDSEYNTKATAARRAQASYIEPTTGPCKYTCVHADWRWWIAWPH